MNKKYFVIDFDSTFVSVESLDELAVIVLQEHPAKEKILQKIKDLTKQGMEGKITFSESLSQRLQLFRSNKSHVTMLCSLLQQHITPSVSRNKDFFQAHADCIYVISGGFKEYILSVVNPFGIFADHVLANTFVFDTRENVIGFDKKNLLSQEKGKARQVQKLDLPGEIYVIGDGYTDYEIKKMGFADNFFVFTENVRRESVIKKADGILESFDGINRLWK